MSTTSLSKETIKQKIELFGRRLEQARAGRGVRVVAREIGVSPATLSRVERGYMPDLETFGRICRWLKVDPAEVLGVKQVASKRPSAAVHFRKDQALHPDTAQALAEMILAAQRALMATEMEGSE